MGFYDSMTEAPDTGVYVVWGFRRVDLGILCGRMGCSGHVMVELASVQAGGCVV